MNRELASRLVTNCDHIDAGLRDECPECIVEVRKMLHVVIDVCAPHQLRGFLMVVSGLAKKNAEGPTTGPEVTDV